MKPGGRFLFVESATVNGESYLDYLVGLSENGGVEIKGGLEGLSGGGNGEGEDAEVDGKAAAATVVTTAADDDGSSIADDDGDTANDTTISPLFDEVGYDQVDMVLQPHVAGVAIKASDADLSAAEKAQKRAREESDRLAELSFDVFERGLKKRRKRKKKAGADAAVGAEK